MAKDIKFDFATNDISLKNGDLEFVEGLDELKQRLVLKLRTFSREMWLSPFAGIPYLRPRPGEDVVLLGRVVSLDDLTGIFENAVTEEPEVESLDTLDLIYDDKTKILTVTIDATVDGEAFTLTATL